MNVYAIMHRDWDEDVLLSVWLRRENAENLIVSRTPSGRRSTAWNAHDENCCRIKEIEVQDAPEEER